MKHSTLHLIPILLLVGFSLMYMSMFPFHSLASTLDANNYRPLQQVGLTPTPVFHYPVVPNATISSFADHAQTPTSSGEDFIIKFPNGRVSPDSSSGFYFYCAGSGGDDYSWVGCAVPNNGTESSCPDNQEMWYDNHKGIDFEYASNWHTGATCDRFRWGSLTRSIYAPAAGKVRFVGNTAGNGNYFKIAHVLNKNGNYDDDKFRSVYLHFDNGGIGVSVNQLVNENDLLGSGGQTGATAVTPHLHFEVQRSNDSVNFTSPWTVDPYGWQAPGTDPWPYTNYPLWRPTLYEAIWRGNQGWTRSVPTDDSGNILWGSATTWSGPVALTGLPGSGNIQAQTNYAVGNTFIQGFWRGNQGWTRNVPIMNGAIQWSSAPAWSGPVLMSGFPGSGDMQAQGDYAVGSTLVQGFWRGNQGWTRNVPITNGVIQWGQAGAWGGPVSMTGLPGSGDMEAQDNYVIGNNYWQTFWRNEQQYTRKVPIVNGVIQWTQASSWSTTTTNENLPGSGTIQAQANYTFP